MTLREFQKINDLDNYSIVLRKGLEILATVDIRKDTFIEDSFRAHKLGKSEKYDVLNVKSAMDGTDRVYIFVKEKEGEEK